LIFEVVLSQLLSRRAGSKSNPIADLFWKQIAIIAFEHNHL